MKKYLAVALACFALASSPMPTASIQSADQPTLQKDTLQITAWTNNSYKGNYDVWSWVPKLEFRVNGHSQRQPALRRVPTTRRQRAVAFV